VRRAGRTPSPRDKPLCARCGHGYRPDRACHRIRQQPGDETM